MYRVSEHNVIVSFAHNSELSILDNSHVSFDNDRSRFHAYEDFEAACDLQGDLYGKNAFFEYIAMIDDVVFGSAWYYIGCGGCKTKATKGPSSLMCAKCGKNDVAGEAQYLAKIFVYDKSDEAVFVLFGDAGRELTGKHASELVRSYFEVPVPDALISTIGQTYKFIVKVSDHNLTGNTRALTVTKILSPYPPTSTGVSAENPITITSEENLVSADGVNQSSKSCQDSPE
ncbi:hypothetical protein N665_0117s0026 [Sinapis alba]|nr:hypothetical protein N665_0117s0026 [Sinapis alba]